MTPLEEYATERQAACAAWTGTVANVEATKEINAMCTATYARGEVGGYRARMESEWQIIATHAGFPDFAAWMQQKYPTQAAA